MSDTPTIYLLWQRNSNIDLDGCLRVQRMRQRTLVGVYEGKALALADIERLKHDDKIYSADSLWLEERPLGLDYESVV